MAFSDYSATPSANTTIAGQNVAPGGPPAAVGPAIRQIMADGKSLTARVGDSVTPKLFGAAGNGTTNDTAAFTSMLTFAKSTGIAINLDGGTYLLTAGALNFAAGDLHIRGGGATLKYTGTGRAFVLDQGGANGEFLEGMSVEDIVIVGGAGITDGFYSRGVVRSCFRNIDVQQVSGKAFHIKHGVSSHYDSLKCSSLPGWTAQPTHGIYLDNNGAGYYTANCTFTNPVMENFAGNGCELADAEGTVMTGGTFEAVSRGLVTSSVSKDNLFIKNWMEGNTVADAMIDGSRNGFIANRFGSLPSGLNVQILATAKGTHFSNGGYIRAVTMAAGSVGTSFYQVGVDENLPGTIGFQGAGQYSRLGCVKVGNVGQVTGTYDDIVGALRSIGVAGTWTPTLSTTSGSITLDPALTQARYRRIGDLVWLQCFLYVQSVSSPGGNVSVNGVPFTIADRVAGDIHVTQMNATATDPLQIRGGPNNSFLDITKVSAGVESPVAGDIKAGTSIAISTTYLTSA